jgi:hypothetical protein
VKYIFLTIILLTACSNETDLNHYITGDQTSIPTATPTPVETSNISRDKKGALCKFNTNLCEGYFETKEDFNLLKNTVVSNETKWCKTINKTYNVIIHKLESDNPTREQYLMYAPFNKYPMITFGKYPDVNIDGSHICSYIDILEFDTNLTSFLAYEHLKSTIKNQGWEVYQTEISYQENINKDTYFIAYEPPAIDISIQMYWINKNKIYKLFDNYSVSDTGYFKTENNLFTDVQSLQKDLYTDYSKEYLRILTDFDEKTGG